MASAKYSPQPVADSESGESDNENSERCVENLQNRMPHWNCCVWFCIIVATAMIISEVLAWLRQPVCGSANFSWNEVIPPNTVNQIERNNLATMLQEYDVLGLWTKLWHFDVYENATALSSSGTDQQAKIFRGSWSNGHLLFGFLEKMAYVDTTGPEKLVALEGRKMWGTIGSSFELWLCSRSSQHSYEVSVDSEPWELTVVYNIHRMPSRELIAQTRFELKDVSFWSDESYWEATVVAAGGNDTGEVIGTVKQNISSFDSKWFVVNKRPDLLPNEVMSFMTLVYDVDETRQS